MLFCALIVLINTHLIKSSPQLLRYKLFMLFLMPLSVILYSFMPEWSKFVSVFLCLLLGVCILGYDIVLPRSLGYNFFNKQFEYNHALILSVASSVILIVWQSHGNTFNIINGYLLIFCSLNFIFLQYVSIQSKYYLFLVPILIFIVTFFSMDNNIDYGNASFIAGPASDLLYSHHHPLTINAQYGSGLTLFVALYYKLMGVFYLDGLIYLLKSLMFVEYLLVYLLAFKFSRSHKIAFLSLISVLIFNFYSMMTIYYSFPQIGFLRFGLIYLVILCYLFENDLPPRILYSLVSLLASIATIWSFESAIYVLPAVLFAEYSNKNLRNFLPIFIACFVICLFIYIVPLIQEGQLYSLTRYYEYANLYVINSENFFSLPLSRLTSLWWLFPVLYAYLLIQILSGKIKNKPVILLVVYGMAIFSYFGGRAHPNNLCIISIPFILLSVYTILHLETLSIEKKNVLLALFFSIFLMANYAITDFGNGVDANNMKIIKGIYSQNVPLLNKSTLFDHKHSKIRQFKENCVNYSVLNNYVENNSLAILEYDLFGAPDASDVRLVDYYGCSHTYNAFGINPYLATAINPKAMSRVVTNLIDLPNHHILVDSRLLDTNKNLPSSVIPMVKQILTDLQASKESEFNLGNTHFIVFKNNNFSGGQDKKMGVYLQR